ncbi:HAMP domain-containing protein [Cohnella fermenti]|uniref:histidine kinase n=2 Tax=Cohnella fermenti TaxID=2565925 RepID=A0A4S4BJV6_9BACL|nr:sensor histidine kinase [Cohnella fermenti]THF74953.1 HAMP domain-containing protein [Cohnella fermenti]
MMASVVCILVPAFLTLLTYNFLTQEAVKKQAVSNAQDSMQLVNGSVTNLLKNMLNIANYIQVSSDLNAYFKQAPAEGEPGWNSYEEFTEASRVRDQLDTLTSLGPRTFVTILLTNGRSFTNYSVDDYNPKKLLEEPWLPELKKLRGFQSYWTGAEPTSFALERMDHPYQISVARTLRLENSDIYGYIVVAMMEDQISGIFGKLNSGRELEMIDGEGRVVSSTDRERIGRLSGYRAPDGAEQAWSIDRIDGKKQLVARQSIAFTDWELVSVQPYREAIVDISSIFNRVFLLQIVSFVAFLALLLALLRAFTKPLVRLGKATSAVQRGNLDVRSGIRGRDEIGRLGFLFDQMMDRVKEMIAEVSATQARKRVAELKMLQAQINPHFLFNVLNSIRMKVLMRGDPDSAKMISSLSKLLRMTISKEKDEIFLHEELDLVASYVELMNLRQKEEVALRLDVPLEAFLIKVPRFFLQPIVENALIHGLKQRAGEIAIRASLEAGAPGQADRPGGAGRLELIVSDDGSGMEEETRLAILERLDAAAARQPAKEGGEAGSFSGIGLDNVAERMRMVFGDGFRIGIRSAPGEGTVITLAIPLKEENSDVQSDAGGR